MCKHVFRSVFVSLLVLGVTVSRATVIEYPLPEGVHEYVRDIGPISVTQHSLIEIYVENVYDEQRWKDWMIQIWVHDSAPDLADIIVDYDNTLDHSNPIEQFVVPLESIIGPPLLSDYKGFYADTWQPLWEQYGTNPVCSGLPHPWGNPRWVSFHIDVPDDSNPVWYMIHDECIPEPATMLLLGIGGIAILRRKVI